MKNKNSTHQKENQKNQAITIKTIKSFVHSKHVSEREVKELKRIASLDNTSAERINYTEFHMSNVKRANA